jgi:anti-sigma-K factor RskA
MPFGGTADRMKAGNRELVDRLASEYVLGTLRGRARKRFERWLVSPQVKAMVIAWEDRLAGLEPPMEKVTPPAAVWRGIEGRLSLRSGRGAMRWLAVAASVLLVSVLGVLMMRDPPQPTLAATSRASIAAEQTIYWQVELLGQNEELQVRVEAEHALAAGQALELWILPAQGNPVSLGLLPTQGEQRRALTATQRAALAGAKQLAVSLEPSGGSPTGLPTGPVLHVAPLTPA